jgi:uridine kinase
MTMRRENTAVLIGIAGASGSGKSFLADYLKSHLAGRSCIILSQDHYYRDRSDLVLEQRQQINYDHPDAIEFSLLINHLCCLRDRQAVEHPLYDFAIHNRKAATSRIGPADVIIVDGILIFSVPEMLPLFNLKIFVETPIDICFIRRLQRDMAERGRTAESVVRQYEKTVRPMFLQYVHPSRQQADLILAGDGTEEGKNRAILDRIIEMTGARKR